MDVRAVLDQMNHNQSLPNTFCSFTLATNSNSLPLIWSRQKGRVLKLNIPFKSNNQFVHNTKEEATASVVTPQDGATLLKQAKLSTAGDVSRN